MVRNTTPEAWVKLVSEEEVRKRWGSGNPLDFGFIPRMSRLVSAHERIAPFFGALFAQIMFVPSGLDRREREMIAAVAAAAQDCHY